LQIKGEPRAEAEERVSVLAKTKRHKAGVAKKPSTAEKSFEDSEGWVKGSKGMRWQSKWQGDRAREIAENATDEAPVHRKKKEAPKKREE